MAETIDLSEVRIDPACAAKLPAAFALRRLVLPICVVEGEFAVAMADPADEATRALVAREAGRAVRAYQADPAQLREELLRLYGESRATASAPAADEPVAAVDRILRAAVLRHASDVHFDPTQDGLRVRFRTDGELEDVTTVSSALQPAVTSRLKVMAGLDIAERRAPQDGAFTWRLQGGDARRVPPMDVRMATLPVRHGERITLRLLEAGGERLTLDSLGLAPSDRATFEEVLERPHGLVLLTGPTGSGKTTTLYAAIQMLLKRRALNILTVEDPIEYEIPGVGQAEVDSADKVNFAKALTGHLVLSTLHTNDAVSAVTRLADMGLAPHLAAATLRLAAAQRLVRALCPHCRAERALERAEAAALGDAALAGSTVWGPKGCLRCAGRGYSGRVGVFELFAPDAECAAAIAAGTHAGDLFAMARRKGMRTLAVDARAMCRCRDSSWSWG